MSQHLCLMKGMTMGRRGRKRLLGLEDEYWQLILAGVGTVEACKLVDEVESRIRELLRVTPTMPPTVVAERIGWEHSIWTLPTRVSELRPVYLPPDPASRTTYAAGELAQFDMWFPDIELPVGYGRFAAQHTLRGRPFDQ